MEERKCVRGRGGGSSNYSRFNEKLEAGYWMQEGCGGIKWNFQLVVCPKAHALGERKRFFFKVYGGSKNLINDIGD